MDNNLPENGEVWIEFPKVDGKSMIKDASNTWVTALTGDIALYTEVQSITDNGDSDTLVFTVPYDWDWFYGGDLSFNPIHTELEEGSLFSAYVKDQDGNTLVQFQDVPLQFYSPVRYDPWGMPILPDGPEVNPYLPYPIPDSKKSG